MKKSKSVLKREAVQKKNRKKLGKKIPIESRPKDRFTKPYSSRDTIVSEEYYKTFGAK